MIKVKETGDKINSKNMINPRKTRFFSPPCVFRFYSLSKVFRGGKEIPPLLGHSLKNHSLVLVFTNRNVPHSGDHFIHKACVLEHV